VRIGDLEILRPNKKKNPAPVGDPSANIQKPEGVWVVGKKNRRDYLPDRVRSSVRGSSKKSGLKKRTEISRSTPNRERKKTVALRCRSTTPRPGCDLALVGEEKK